MKKIFLAFALLVGSLSYSQAQQQAPRTPEERAKTQSQRLADRLKLDAEQKSKLEAIFLAQAKSVDSLRATTAEVADRRQSFEKMRPIREQADKKIKALLNDEQKKAYATYQEEMKSRMENRSGRRGGSNAQPSN
ncbi:hypothetical protein [Desertivirga xinjiangensis]|uniref:hypothetical protein n=1 Tax=Desertivirga xinjiangensis TaxID=539206 RepID=UPI00210EB533|nr:hypothetical protein [Pedobacter xinjiangensis]